MGLDTMLKLLLFSTFLAISQGEPNGFSLQHRSFINPVFQRSEILYVPNSPTIEESYQFHATIFVDNGGLCGGVLVDSDKVLTSAQCVKGGTNFEIFLNRRDLYNDDISLNANETAVNATTPIIHPEFTVNHEGTVNDLALLILNKRVNKAPVVVGGTAYSNPLTEYIDVPLLGFGLSNGEFVGIQGRYIQKYLQWQSTHSKPIRECRGILPGVQTNGKHVCTEAAGPSSCYGDPGSPLVMGHRDGYYELIGIASFAAITPCDQYGPTAFTYVRHYYEWLAANGVPIRFHNPLPPQCKN